MPAKWPERILAEFSSCGIGAVFGCLVVSPGKKLMGFDTAAWLCLELAGVFFFSSVAAFLAAKALYEYRTKYE